MKILFHYFFFVQLQYCSLLIFMYWASVDLMHLMLLKVYDASINERVLVYPDRVMILTKNEIQLLILVGRKSIG